MTLPTYRGHKRRGIYRLPGKLSNVEQVLTDFLIDYLIVGGGGGGGSTSIGVERGGGGGGGGGVLIGNFQLIPSTVYNVVVGNGGP